MSLGRRIRDKFYTKVDSQEYEWLCACGVQRKQRGYGYTNLVSHVQAQHRSDYDAMITTPSVSIRSSNKDFSLFYPKKTLQTWGWIDLVCASLQPFAIVENISFRRHIKYEPISRNTLHKYMAELVGIVEQKIQKLLPSKFAIIFDGWSVDTTHYVGVFASFPSRNELGYEKVLLALSPFFDEDSQSADAYFEFTEFVLGVYGRNINNVTAMIGDNCKTNKSFVDKTGRGFIGCASHRFNLAVKDLIAEHEPAITKVHELMKKLHTPNIAGKLLKVTHLKPKSYIKTRWSSTYEMLQRFLDLKDHIRGLENDELDRISPSTSEYKDIQELTKKFRELESVSKALQSDSCTLPMVRALFDTVIEEFPSMKNRLSSDAEIVLHPYFESGIIKIMRMEQHLMNLNEKHDMACFEVEDEVSVVPEENSSLTLAQKALKKRRISNSTYTDLRYILPTSNICERLFSTAGYALNDRRRGVLPVNFERQIFLHANSHLWGISDVNTAVNNK